MNKKILRSKEAEIAKAGRMVFDALFGDSDEFQKKIEGEIEGEGDGGGAVDPEAITVPGHSLVRCGTCAREQVVAPDVDVRTLAQHGWQLDAGTWRCAFCK